MVSCFPDVWAPLELSIVTGVLSGIIGLISIIGNGLIVIIVVKDPLKKLHTSFNYFLVNLAVSDLIVGVLTMPVSVYAHYEETTGHIDSILPPLLHLSTFVSGTASLLSITALAIDRYIAIVHALKYRQHLSWKHCNRVTIIIWVLALSLPILYYVFGYINYLMFYANSAILIGLIVISVVYRKVIVYLEKQTTELRTMLRLNSTEGEVFRMKRLVREQNVTHALLFMVIVFVATYVPAMIMIYILHFCHKCNCDFRHVLRDTQFLFIATNSCVNPFICTIRLTNFKQSFNALLRRNIPQDSPSFNERFRAHTTQSDINTIHGIPTTNSPRFIHENHVITNHHIT